MDVHLGVEHPFESGFHQHLEQTIDVVEGLSLGGEFAGELFGLEFEDSIHA